MKKKLEEMTLEELWRLFPITLSPHNPLWAGWAEEEMDCLNSILAAFNPVINHIGSTAIPVIQAKPIIDILVELSPVVAWSAIKEAMLAAGYICMSESGSRLSFNKGYTPDGYAPRVFHIHFHRSGDNEEIRFRDYLRSHPADAREYERLKQHLLAEYRHDRDAYTRAKSGFIQRIAAFSKRLS